MSVDRAQFAELMASFATGVTVITAIDAEGIPRGATVNALTSVSAEPPLCLICLDENSNTLPALRHANSFVINVLRAGQEALSARFAGKSTDKFCGVAWRPAPVTGQPVIDAPAAHIECRVRQTVKAGDHWIFISSVESGAADRDAIPLMYYRRRYGAWPSSEVWSESERALASGRG